MDWVGEVVEHNKIRSTAEIVGGAVGLYFGGRLAVMQGAVPIAEAWGMSKELIGLSVIAIGTSLPELATSTVAAYKRNTDIAVGNVVGSNIFNIFIVLGVIGGSILVYLLVSRLIPPINIWEQKELVLYKIHKPFHRTKVLVLGKPE